MIGTQISCRDKLNVYLDLFIAVAKLASTKVLAQVSRNPIGFGGCFFSFFTEFAIIFGEKMAETDLMPGMVIERNGLKN